jgi:hypothetical protein
VMTVVGENIFFIEELSLAFAVVVVRERERERKNTHLVNYAKGWNQSPYHQSLILSLFI